ncbi:hypothetical protein HS088_TW15G00486 [Tripterygium wilfordii]|uniref:Uncharacterized protein n=1 Tax=Tripterygium wilfordii TaxID=458696 RepID=A0A7J7CLN8_TRIWF|nr:uncharacterized protein LOC120017305 [Tripterygium wilfordii]KAF5734987.1 hypothetical protein HS088_TW15G00486 [Tripterygium wilfordii]
MGNCSIKRVAGKCPDSVRIITKSGGVGDLKGPMLVGDVLNGHPGYGIFRCASWSNPLPKHEWLINGHSYYLLPLEKIPIEPPKVPTDAATLKDFENGAAAVQVLPSLGNGVWRVKLVIGSKELEEILKQEGNTEALIETMRAAAMLTPMRRSKKSWKPKVFKVPVAGEK